jgi:sec-independent protein translocase protein TatB
VFDLSIGKILVLAVIALVVFGPEQLPKIAAQAGRALRDLRRMAEGARSDLREGLGPEFSDFDITDLNPKNFVRKHLFDDLDDLSAPALMGDKGTEGNGTPVVRSLPAGERPPYDAEAT